MPKAIVVEDDQLEHAVRVARVSSPENGIRDAALLLACFGTGMTVTELCRLKVSDYLGEDCGLIPAWWASRVSLTRCGWI